MQHSKIGRRSSAQGVRRGKAALSSGCKSHPATLQPEAVGAAMEVTKWLKPSESVSRIRFRLGYGSILGGFLFFGPGPELIDRLCGHPPARPQCRKKEH